MSEKTWKTSAEGRLWQDGNHINWAEEGEVRDRPTNDAKFLWNPPSPTSQAKRMSNQKTEATLTSTRTQITGSQDTDGDQRDSSGWSASLYNKTASFVYSSVNIAPVLRLLDPRPGEKILDLGCGSGEITVVLQAIVEGVEGGLAVGTDKSESMVEKAKRNWVKHLFVADAQDLDLPHNLNNVKFDAVFSNATLHWCKSNPTGVLDGVRKVLKVGGRFVAEMGGFMNCVGVRSAIHQVLKARGYNPQEMDPWYFPSVEEYSKLLESAGFEISQISLNPRVTPLDSETGMADWLNLFVRSSFLKDIPEKEANEIIRQVVDTVRVDCQDSQGRWTMMYTRLRFSAVLKGESTA